MSKIIKFQYFRYFLNHIHQTSLFHTDNSQDKNEILQKILSTKQEYRNKTSQLVYVCHKTLGNTIFGKLGKKSTIKKNTPSSDDFIEEIETDYPYCNILFDSSTDPKLGQRIAFEYKSSVFQNPESQMKSLESHLNTILFSKGYSLSINPIIDKKEFWDLIQLHQGKIEKLTFSYAVPNLFKLDNSLSQDLKDSEDKYGSTNISIELENKAGNLNISNRDDFIQQSAEYTGNGGGEYKLKIKGTEQTIRSDQNTKTKSFQEIDFSTNDPDVLKDIAKSIF